MKAIIFALLMGWRKPFGICFVSFLFALGSAHADSGKGKPTSLKPLRSTPIVDTPVVTTKVDPEPARIPRSCVVVNQSSAMPEAAGQYLPGVFLPNCCCGGAALNVPALYLAPQGGITSNVQYEICSQ